MKSLAMKSLLAVAALALAGSSNVADAAAVQGTVRDGYCDAGEFCLYYNSWERGYGSGSDFRSSLSNYGSTQPGCYEFRGPGAGRGQCIKNNAASYWNRSSRPVRVYANSGYSGRYVTIAPGDYGNLPTGLKNNEASHKFL